MLSRHRSRTLRNRSTSVLKKGGLFHQCLGTKSKQTFALSVLSCSVCRFVDRRYSDGFQEVNCRGCCIWSDLYVVGWILSEAHAIMVILVSIQRCHYVLLRRNP